MSSTQFLQIALDLESVGLLWQPEIGDEVFGKQKPAETSASVLVDTGGMTPPELRTTYLWLPTVEQMVTQIEARQGILLHAGLELSQNMYRYKTMIHSRDHSIEGEGLSLREAVGIGLRDLLMTMKGGGVH